MEIAVRTPSLMEDPALSRNASSSRAIPVSKLIDDVMNDPAVPIFWGKNQKGMQAAEHRPYVDFLEQGTNGEPDYIKTFDAEEEWLLARDEAVARARRFERAGYHKQIVNRLLEPFSHITVVVTATEWDNFFALRDHPDAEPHIRLLAQRMRAAIDAAPEQILEPGEWHWPFLLPDDWEEIWTRAPFGTKSAWDLATKLCVARCASTSYKTVEGFDMTLDRAVALHDKLVSSTPMHASPLEPVCQADSGGPVVHMRNGGGGDCRWHWDHWGEHRNFVGFRQYRAMLEQGVKLPKWQP